jgi:hypothetical protein
MKLDNQIKDHIRSHTIRAYQLYVQRAHPFDFDPIEDIYRHAFTEEQWNALQTVLKLSSLRDTGFKYATSFQLIVRDHEERGGELPKETMWPDWLSIPVPVDTVPNLYGGVPISALPDSTRVRLERWIKRGYVFDQGENKLDSVLSSILREATTVGHVVRLWPVLQRFLGDYARKAVENRKARSPIPPGAFEYYLDRNGEWKRGGLKPQFDMRRYATIERILLGAALLEGKPSAKYPTFYG